MADHVDADARLVYDYMRMDDTPQPADAVFCLCSLDVRVADRAAQLYLDGYGRFLIFSGGSGKLTVDRFDKPEAEVFADRARALGVPSDKMLLEPDSTNTGENVRFTYELLQQRGITVGSFVLVQKPYMVRRAYATFMKQWPGEDVHITATSPRMAFEDYPDADNPKEFIINLMVGDLVRIRDYPAKGFQIEQAIPDDVWAAGQRLIAAGYTAHLPA